MLCSSAQPCGCASHDDFSAIASHARTIRRGPGSSTRERSNGTRNCRSVLASKVDSGSKACGRESRDHGRRGLIAIDASNACPGLHKPNAER